MKETILNLYLFKEIEFHTLNNNYYFLYNKEKYYIESLVISREELIELKNLENYGTKYEIQTTKNNELLFEYNKINYIIYKINSNKKNSTINQMDKKNSKICKINWYNMISKKIDNIEYEYKHIRGKYKIIDNSIDYYIGMAENSLKYIKLSKYDTNNLKISHRRILNCKRVDGPQNIIIDFSIRDLSEYLKIIFFKKNDLFEKVDELLNMEINNFDLLFSRMIYPSFYFDLLEEMINEESISVENKIKDVIKTSSNYEKFLKHIFIKISQKKELEKVPWIY